MRRRWRRRRRRENNQNKEEEEEAEEAEEEEEEEEVEGKKIVGEGIITLRRENIKIVVEGIKKIEGEY